jgi:hypothetical protein
MGRGQGGGGKVSGELSCGRTYSAADLVQEVGKTKPQATATDGQCWCDNKLLAAGTCR